MAPELSLSARVASTTGLLAKADGKDKLLAALQYAALLAGKGEKGTATDLQKALAAARKPFRVWKPVETLAPLVFGPPPKGPAGKRAVARLKAVFMAAYFGFDHVVWAGQVGLYKNKDRQDRAQKLSLWGWLLGSVCSGALDLSEIAAAAAAPDKTEEEKARKRELEKAAQAKYLTLLVAVAQVGLAGGLLGVIPAKPRTLGTLGVVASALNVYQLTPALKPKGA